jgi:hypothetical protein
MLLIANCSVQEGITGEKMLIYPCTCGKKILIVPDITEMALAIRAHLLEHKIITGKWLTEKYLTEEILSCLSDEQVDDCLVDWLHWDEQRHIARAEEPSC